MASVSIRELRNHGGDVVDRVERGEPVIITRGGRAVAELRPVSRPPQAASVLVERWSRLPEMDPRVLRSDIDQVLDPRL